MSKHIYTHRELVEKLEETERANIQLRKENETLGRENCAHVEAFQSHFEEAEKLAINASQLAALVAKYQKQLGI